MICLSNTDTLEGGASINAVVNYSVYGFVGTTFDRLATGQLSNIDPSVLYTAGGAIDIASVIFVNTHTAAVNVNLYTDLGNGGNPQRMIPENFELDAGYAMHFDGNKILVITDSGEIVAGLSSGSRIVQVVKYQTGAVATGTTMIPYDDTIPQNTEGNQYMTCTITPTNASNILRIDVIAYLVHSVSGLEIAALFQDNIASALAVGTTTNYFTDIPTPVKFTHFMTAGGTSATTFKVRGGTSLAGTTTFNGANGSRKFGGALASSITITEIAI